MRPHISISSNPMPKNPSFNGKPPCRVPSFNKSVTLTCHVNPLWNIKKTKISANMDFLRPHMSFSSNPMPINPTFNGKPHVEYEIIRKVGL